MRQRKIRFAAVAVLAVATLSGCVTVARMVIPTGLSERAERVEVTGLGAGTRGRTTVLGQSLEFTRSASRLALFDERLVTDRGRVYFTLQAAGQPALPVNCGMKQRSVTLGVVGFEAKPFAFECTLGGPTPATLSVQEGRSGVRTLKAERRGELRFDGRSVALRSVHEVQGGALPLAAPIGYAFEEAGRPVAAVEINGLTPVLLLPATGGAALRQRVLQAALALALLWDPAGAA